MGSPALFDKTSIDQLGEGIGAMRHGVFGCRFHFPKSHIAAQG
jgi:hypothetical protein